MAFFFDKLAGGALSNVSGVGSDDLDSPRARVETPLEKTIASATKEAKTQIAAQAAKTQIAREAINNAYRVWNSTTSGPEGLADLNAAKRDIETLQRLRLIEPDPTKQDAPTKAALAMSRKFFIDKGVVKGKSTRLELDANFVQVLKRDIPFFRGLFESEVGRGRIFDGDRINISDPHMIAVLEALKNVYSSKSNYILKESELNELIKFALHTGEPEILNIAAEHTSPQNYKILLKYGFDTNNYEIMTLMFKHANLDVAKEYVDKALSLKNEDGKTPNDSWETIKAIKDNIHSISANSGSNYEKTRDFVEGIISISTNSRNFPNLSAHNAEIFIVKDWGFDSQLSNKAERAYLDLRQVYFDLTGTDIQRDPKLMLKELVDKQKKGEITDIQIKDFLDKVIRDCEAIAALRKDISTPVVKFYATHGKGSVPMFLEEFTKKSRQEMFLSDSPIHLLMKLANACTPDKKDKESTQTLKKIGVDLEKLSTLPNNLKEAMNASLPIGKLHSGINTSVYFDQRRLPPPNSSPNTL